MSLASLYGQLYSAWHPRRIASGHTGRQSTTPDQMAQPTENQQSEAATPNAAQKDKKSSEPLFGPSIGSVSSGPAWTIGTEKKVIQDELTPETIASWIEKSKDSSQPTTTLQALVNLKRPTLRLSPLQSIADDPSSMDQDHHGLEFEYDCDAPKCGIYVHVFLPKNHPDAPTTSSHYPLCRILVFELVVDGGFGNRLKLEEGATLELTRFENANDQQQSTSELQAISETPLSGEPSSSGDSNGDSTNNNVSARSRRRFTHFHFRKRTQNPSVSGPALAVVDAEPASQEGKKDKEDSEEGVRVTIRLAALDEQGCELASPNEQITYLHIVRFGQKPEPTEGEKAAEDTRPWVVRVVKREATIGPHTFQLQEIYGLSSSSVHPAPPMATTPSITHSYPPEEGQQPGVADDDDPQSECLLCLSSPREVVLLPCRHLVACKDCALNMVEFGAGGTITQASDPVTGGPEDSAAGATATATLVTPTVPGNTSTNPRRKRKAKGWFCPVCRQPYTSMLRITTSAPPPSENKEDASGSEDESTPNVPPVESASNPATTEVRTGGGLLGGSLRPTFLRGLSLSRNSPNDVESQAGLGRVGA